MSKKYLAKILARDLNGLNLISLYCHKSILKVSDIKFLKKNKIFLLSLQRNSIVEIFKKCNLNTSTLFSISKHLVLLAGTVPI